jgi:hypothetical protein
MPRVEFLYWPECPSHEQALAELRQAMTGAGLDPSAIEVGLVETDAEAEAARFHGSPTIRIDGMDLLPPTDDEPAGLSCRIYWLRDGRPSPTPDPRDLADALAAAPSGAAPEA